MKRFALVLMAVSLLLVYTGVASASSGCEGIFCTGDYMQYWGELFQNGQEGVPGNQLLGLGVQTSTNTVVWRLYGALLETVSGPNPMGAYETHYAGGTLELLAAGPWAPAPLAAGTVVHMAGFDNLTWKYDNGLIYFDITGTGSAPGLSVNLHAWYFGTPQAIPPEFNLGPGMGDTLNCVTISASAVPIPAAAWLFGPGLIGIAAIRRRFTA